MDVVVGYATAHGSTKGIADRIADRLRARGTAVTVAEMVHVDDIEHFDAAILGSAIHSGKWLAEAELFVDRHAKALADRPTWLFSVCSVGDSNSFFSERLGRFMAKQRKDSTSLSRWRVIIGTDHHRYFSGAIERDHWSRLGNLFLRATGGHFGDHRDWADVEAWADSISDALAQAGEG